MWKIGLTGSIATGKSKALEAFGDLGVPVFSSDEAVHELYAGAAVAPVEKLFPGVAKDGVIDRAALSAALLQRPEKLKDLEAAVHPLVHARIAGFLRSAQASGAALAVVDIPLLFETGFDYGFDRVVVVIADEASQRQRALARPGMTVQKLDVILARQMPQDEKRKRADYVLDGSGGLDKMAGEVKALVEILRANPKESG